MECLGGIKKNAVVFLMMLLSAATLSAQSGTTSVRGVITDQKGASVPDATITLTSADIGVTLRTQSDKDGAYQFLEVRPATYSLTAEASGFASYRQTNLQLLVATPATNNFTMQLAQGRYNRGSNCHHANHQYNRCNNWERIQPVTDFGSSI